MANLDTGRPTTRRNSIFSLGLVGVPSMQESVQTADEFDLHFNPNTDLNAGPDADVNAHIDAFCANTGLADEHLLSDLQITQNLALKTDFEPLELSQACVPNEQCPSYIYCPTGLSSLPVQHDFTYTEPQVYYSAHEAPYFDNCYGALTPSDDLSGTLGLSATPGNNPFAGYRNSQCLSQPHAYPTESWILPAEAVIMPTVQTDYVSFDDTSSNDTSIQFATYSFEEPPAATPKQTFKPISIPPPVTKEHTQQGPQESDSNSDSDYRDTEIETNKNPKRAAQKKPRKDSVSSASPSTASQAEPVKYLPGEKPKKVDAKPWVRTNANTEGDTRTAKINNWKNKYVYKPLPLGTWSSGKYTFKYTQYENVDFLTEAPMSTGKIKEYILNYPCDDQKRLVLWIQKMPADQGRRYGSKQHSKCAFKDCPIQRYVEGTISTGEYRLAFDEKYYTYGDQVDPYDCAAYAHLYCMEQFLDFEQVCQIADVRIDTRLDMPLEPNGKAAFSMVDAPARHDMARFVKAALKGKLRQTQGWYNYPVHTDYDRDQQKPHECTLTYLAHCMYEAHQDDSHKKQAALRRVTVSQRRVHLGDLEISVADKRIMIDVFGGKKKGRNSKVEEHYDKRILHHIARAKREAEDFLKGKRSGKNSGKKGKKRKIVERDETDDEHHIYGTEQHAYATPSQNTRASRQKKQRVNYAETPIDKQEQYAYPYTRPQQLQPAQAPEQQVQHLQTYVATNFDYSSEAAQTQHPIDPMLETPYGLYAVPETPKLNIADFTNFPTCEDDLPNDNLEKLLALDRRQSCTAEFGTMSILKSPAPTHDGQTPRPAVFSRRAVFDAQPVNESKEHRVNDPANLMSGRRSARLAANKQVANGR